MWSWPSPQGACGRSSPSAARSRRRRSWPWCPCRCGPRPSRGPWATGCRRMLVSLATGVADPAARLRHIRDGMRAAKEQSRAVGPEVFASWAEAAFPAVATRLSRLVTNLRLFDHVAPPFNLVVSNVPGPDVPPLPGRGPDGVDASARADRGGGRGQRDRLLLPRRRPCGVQACWDLVPDVAVLAIGMEAALDELVAEAAPAGPAGALVARRAAGLRRFRPDRGLQRSRSIDHTCHRPDCPGASIAWSTSPVSRKPEPRRHRRAAAVRRVHPDLHRADVGEVGEGGGGEGPGGGGGQPAPGAVGADPIADLHGVGCVHGGGGRWRPTTPVSSRFGHHELPLPVGFEARPPPRTAPR